jgi:NAD(P)H-nitrite reductase large subunit
MPSPRRLGSTIRLCNWPSATRSGDTVAAADALKISGVDVYAAGNSATTTPPGHDEIIHSDTRDGTYRRLVLHDDRLTSGVLIGDTSTARQLSELLRTGEAVPPTLLTAHDATTKPLSDDPAATICSCNAVTVADVQAAIQDDSINTVAEVGLRTRATTGCGGCAADVEELLATAAASSSEG